MLQRAATNAYSWWWASHIRTKQSNWLEKNLEDMETKVQNMLKLIEQDGDSFAQRAEMYYKKRPELIHIVEEFYRGYRALAERYDHISGDLHKARGTIASVFPDQVPMDIASTGHPGEEKAPPALDRPEFGNGLSRKPPPPPPPSLAKRLDANISISDLENSNPEMDKATAQEEVRKLQKHILVLQTEKEFMKSSYEAGLAKYWEVENQVLELQARVCCLQEDYGLGNIMENEEEQSIMAVTVLKSCEQMLGSLQEEQQKSMAEADIELERIKIMEEKLKSLKDEFLKHHPEIHDNKHREEEQKVLNPSVKSLEDQVSNPKKEKTEYQEVSEKIVKDLQVDANNGHRFSDLSRLIDELVNKVVSLETEVSSQNLQILRLKSEADQLQEHLQGLQDDNASLKDDSKTMNNRIKGLEEALQGIQDLKLQIEEQKARLQTHLAEACGNLDDLTEKMNIHNDNIEAENYVSVQLANEEGVYVPEETVANAENRTRDEGSTPKSKVDEQGSELNAGVKNNEKIEEHVPEFDAKVKLSDEKASAEVNAQGKSDNEDFKSASAFQNLCLELISTQAWQKFLEGMEDREKTLLTEYTTILGNFKETKERLSELERQNQTANEFTLEKFKLLETASAHKDAEIESLKEKLSIIQMDSKRSGTKSCRGKDSAERKSHELKNSKMSSAFDGDHKNVERSEDLSTGNAKTGNSHPKQKDIKIVFSGDSGYNSPMEEKFRKEIDSLLEENLDFWMRFSASLHQIQKFQTASQESQVELLKLKKEKGKDDNHTNASISHSQSMKSNVEAIQKQLRELQGELLIWLDQNALLKDELKHRFSSLCNILEDLSQVSKTKSKNSIVCLTDYQTAKFQGEILNMQQENNKVTNELQASLDHVRGLQLEIEKNLLKLKENYGLSESKHHHLNHIQYMRQTLSRTRIPLRTFIFGKPKKPSLFSCMNPALQKQYSDLRAGKRF